MTPFCIGVDRNTGRSVTLRPDVLFAHGLIAGGTGMGKSQLANALCRHCLHAGIPFVYLDPHGDTYHDLVAYATARRVQNRLVTIDANLAADTFVFPLNFCCRMAWIRQRRER